MASTGRFDNVTQRIQTAEHRIANQLNAQREIHQKMESVKQRRSIQMENLKDHLNDVERSFNEKKLVIVVSGATSAGKSTVINALMRRDLLFTAVEHCTPCSVSIETSADIDEPFVTVGKPSDCCQRLSISRLQALSDAKSAEQSSKPLYVFLPQDQNDESVFRVPNLRIVDSPGLYEEVDESSMDIEGDAFVFVVDLDTGVKWDELEKKLRRTKGRLHSWKAVFFVYNKCDHVEKFDKDRFEQGKQEKLDKAVDFLTKNGVYSNTSSAKSKVFFLSAHAALMARQYKASMQHLKECIDRSVKCKSNANVAVLFVCGGDEVGKTTLCNDLCELRARSADDLDLKKCALDDLAETEDRREDRSRKRTVAVVDSPPDDKVSRWIVSDALRSSVLAIVVSATSSLKKIQKKIEKYLGLLPESSRGAVEVFLIVTKFIKMKETEGDDKARKLKSDIEKLWRDLGRVEGHVFFLEKDDLLKHYVEAFSDVETQVVEAAHENFEAIKLKRIEGLMEELKGKTTKKVKRKLEELEKMQHALTSVPGNLSVEGDRRGSTRAMRFLEESKVDISELTSSQVEKLFLRFIDFCRNELGADFEEVIVKATDHLDGINADLKQRARSRLDYRLSELQNLLHLRAESECFDLRGQLRCLQSSIPTIEVEEEKKEVGRLKEEEKTLEEELSKQAAEEKQQRFLVSDLQKKKEKKERKIQKLQAELEDLESKESECKESVEERKSDIANIVADLRTADSKREKLEEEAAKKSGFNWKDGLYLAADIALAAMPAIGAAAAAASNTGKIAKATTDAARAARAAKAAKGTADAAKATAAAADAAKAATAAADAAKATANAAKAARAASAAAKTAKAAKESAETTVKVVKMGTELSAAACRSTGKALEAKEKAETETIEKRLERAHEEVSELKTRLNNKESEKREAESDLRKVTEQREKLEKQLATELDNLLKVSEDLDAKNEEVIRLSEQQKARSDEKAKKEKRRQEKKTKVQERMKEHESRRADFRMNFPGQLQEENDRITSIFLHELQENSRRFVDEEIPPLKEEEQQFRGILSQIENLDSA